MTTQAIRPEDLAGSGAAEPHAPVLLAVLNELLTRVAALEGGGEGEGFVWTGFPVMNGSVGSFRAQTIASSGSGGINLRAPADFGSLIEAAVICVPAVPGDTDANIDRYTAYAADGEPVNQHQESETASEFLLVTNQITEISYSDLLNDLAAGDAIAMRLQHNVIGCSVYYLGGYLRYTKA